MTTKKGITSDSVSVSPGLLGEFFGTRLKRLDRGMAIATLAAMTIVKDGKRGGEVTIQAAPESNSLGYQVNLGEDDLGFGYIGRSNDGKTILVVVNLGLERKSFFADMTRITAMTLLDPDHRELLLVPARDKKTGAFLSIDGGQTFRPLKVDQTPVTNARLIGNAIIGYLEGEGRFCIGNVADAVALVEGTGWKFTNPYGSTAITGLSRLYSGKLDATFVGGVVMTFNMNGLATNPNVGNVQILGNYRQDAVLVTPSYGHTTSADVQSFVAINAIGPDAWAINTVPAPTHATA